MKNGNLKRNGLLLAFLIGYHLSAQEIVKGEFKNEDPHPSYTPSFYVDGTDKPVKNVILMIGDGMGLAHICSGMYANQGKLTITNLRTCGFVRTQSSDGFITDSAASGTAYSTGEKTNNGALGMDADGQPVQNLPEKLAPDGYVSGIVTTDNLDGATPAAFFAHQPQRNLSQEIWADMANSPLIFFSAGSYEMFQEQPKDTQKAIQKKYTILNEPDTKAMEKSERLGYLPDKSKTASVNMNRGDFLPATTQLAIQYLSARSTKGFFLMVEGARIDKSAHQNDYQAVIREVLDFDKAVEAAIRFAEKDGNTLVIISADHETGALALRDGNIEEGRMKGIFVSKGHTPIMVPLFAYGPQSGKFTGVQENNEVSKKIYQLLHQ
ncbi:alkaline phosphatase [Parabacteroides pacaensis]|uniref:alkaline phosphatase n=1 Tax=Parabacteroides pacaensis TaxID=2086575 RepID=UPI000D100C29|nr:alkaline phosphatase [Parabacteroides pacaensis]